MSRAARVMTVVAVLAVGVGTWWLLFVALPRWTAPKPATPPPVQAAAEAPTSKIRARLFHLAGDGLRLVPVDAEVPFGEGTLEQGRQLVLALLQPAPDGTIGVIPRGTTLAGFYLSPHGIAFVDLSPEASQAHPGGSLDEVFTVYSVVNTLTDNLPAITGVQLLVNGRQVDTLAGHVDVRRPLTKDLRWTELPGGGEQASGENAASEPGGVR